MTHQNGNTGASVGAHLDQKLDALKSRMVEVKAQAKAKSNEVLERITTLIKENPLKAVGIAFAAGYITMRLLRR
ncbi:MAG TPA: hypothetical protein VN253_19615 [Kofleriaceae bacterium]|nr:hypothetical protein [Kofleriaceae bacterium]